MKIINSDTQKAQTTLSEHFLYSRLSKLSLTFQAISSANLVLGEIPWLLVLLTCLRHPLGS